MKEAAVAPRASRAPGQGGHLVLENLSVRFGGVQVFRALNITIAPGGVLGVIGPNGAGKTTLINAICGRVPPVEGRVYLDSHDVTRIRTNERCRLGLVRSFQQTNSFGSATASENIRRAIRFSGGKERDFDQARELIEAFDLGHNLDDVSSGLPYGKQKLLGLVMAYVTKPRVLLLDEPAAGLERRERHRVDELIRFAQLRFGSTVLIIEHDMELVKRLCPRIVVLNDGAIIADGAPAAVLSDEAVVAAYLGTEEV
jgi:branched-chain amino acid transport system ATP-binding protein